MSEVPDVPDAGLGRGSPFRWLWAAHTISEFGGQVTVFAIPVIAAVLLGASPGEMGVLLAAGLLPYPLLALPAGVWVDRLPKRTVMIVCGLGRIVVLSTIPITAAMGALSVPQLGAVTFGMTALGVVFDLARLAYVPSLVSQSSLVAANQRLSLSSSSAGLTAPGLAGVLVQALTAPMLIVADMVSLGVSVVLLGRMRPAGAAPTRDPAAPRETVRHAIVVGLRFSMRVPALRAVAFGMAAVNLFSFVLSSILVVYLTRDLGMSAALLGLLVSVTGVGTIGGSLLASVLSRRLGLGRATVVGALLFTAGPVLLALAAGPGTSALLLVACGQLVSGAGLGLVDVSALSLRQGLTPDHLQGRTGSFVRMVQWAAKPLGSLLGGFCGEALGLRPTIWIAVVGGVTAACWLWFSPVVHTSPAGRPARTGGPHPLS